MAETLGIRASQELQSRFKQFAEESGLGNHSDFLAHLLTLHAVSEAVNRVPTLEGAATAVTDMSDRVCKILIGTAETISMNQEKLKAETESQIQEHRQEADKKIMKLTNEIENLKNTLEEFTSINKNMENEIQNMKNELISSGEHEKDLVRVIDDKITIINGNNEKIIGLEKKLRLQDELIKGATDAQSELDFLRMSNKERTLEIRNLEFEKEKALNDLENTLRNLLNEQQTRHNDAVSDFEKRLMEKEKTLIELEKRLRNEMGELQNQYASNINIYEKKVMSLLDELERRSPRIPSPES